MFTLNELEKIIHERAKAGTKQSYTSRLLGKGVNKCAGKFGEEAIEAIIAATANNRDELTREAADVLFHLLVLLKTANISLRDVQEELHRRTSKSGLEEKASRQEGQALASGN